MLRPKTRHRNPRVSGWSKASEKRDRSEISEDNDSEDVDDSEKEDIDQSETMSQATSSRNGARPLSPATTNTDADVESITKTMSSLRFVPPSIRFGGRGRGRRRGGLSKH